MGIFTFLPFTKTILKDTHSSLLINSHCLKATNILLKGLYTMRKCIVFAYMCVDHFETSLYLIFLCKSFSCNVHICFMFSRFFHILQTFITNSGSMECNKCMHVALYRQYSRVLFRCEICQSNAFQIST
jgi:hypothetical protein